MKIIALIKRAAKMAALCAAALTLCACVREAPPGEVIAPTPVPTAAPAPTPVPTPAPTPEPTPTPEPEDQRLIRETLEGMSLEEKIGQLLLFGVAGTRAPSAEYAAFLDKYPVGNVILFGDNIDRDDGAGGFEAAKALISCLEETHPLPIPRIFAADVEGGSVVRFEWEPPIPSAKKQGRMSPDEVRGIFASVGARLRETGISLDLAPVMDVSGDPAATFLGSRIISSDPAAVKCIGSAVIEGLKEGGCASCAKHFPGHGSSDADSHYEAPVSHLSREELYSCDIEAFRGAAEAGADCVMTAHVLYPALDPDNIATLSPAVITGILREELGFSGVVISDDMRMRGLASAASPGEAAVRFIEAGGDMLLCGADVSAQEEIILALRGALASGEISAERIDGSVRRVLALKLELGLIG
ncbi:MAG: hypothetical protein IKQ36_00810 [Clostridia bacterium]|nr:hypothetical protein [Clostridia bacterium]